MAMVEFEQLQLNTMEMKDLKAVKVVGKGAIGTVFLVHKEGCDKPLALKAMSKSAMVKTGDGLRRASVEKDILSRLNHPLLPALVGQIETDKILGWIVDYCSGGDLNALRHKQSDKIFSQSIIRFYAAEIVLAVEHLHSQGIVYRDLKPENVLIQANGHIMLTDFDLSTRLLPIKQIHLPDIAAPPDVQVEKQRLRPSGRRLDSVFSFLGRANSARLSAGEEKTSVSNRSLPVSSGRLNSFVGTEEYLSPEVVMGTGHEFPVDWWALGVLLYEMAYGKTPFKGATRKETFCNILVRDPEVTGPRTPLNDLIQKLLAKKSEKRLGSDNGASDVKNHVFFRGLDWQAVQDVCRAPFVPPVVPLHGTKTAMNIEEYVERLHVDVVEAKLSGSKSADFTVGKNWVRRLSKAGEADGFAVF